MDRPGSGVTAIRWRGRGLKWTACVFAWLNLADGHSMALLCEMIKPISSQAASQEFVVHYAQERILLRFSALLETADRLCREADETGLTRTSELGKFKVQALHLLNLLLPGTKIYLQEWRDPPPDSHVVPMGWYKGILDAAKDDYISGLLGDQKTLICAEVFTDFLQQADYLLREGYKDPAAVIAGTVLEDGLRRLCDLKGLQRGEKDTINPMNQKLYKESAYNKLWFEEVGAKAVIRNDAAHGNYSGYGSEDVRGLIEFIRRFMREFLPSTP